MSDNERVNDLAARMATALRESNADIRRTNDALRLNNEGMRDLYGSFQALIVKWEAVAGRLDAIEADIRNIQEHLGVGKARQ